MRIARACWLLVCRSVWWRRASSKPEISMLIAIMGILNTNPRPKINIPSPFWSHYIASCILHLAGTPECQTFSRRYLVTKCDKTVHFPAEVSRSKRSPIVEHLHCAKIKTGGTNLSRKCRDCIRFISLQNDWIYTLCCQHFFFEERLLYNHRCGYTVRFRGRSCTRCTPGPKTIQKKYPGQERNSWKQTIMFWLAEGKLKAKPLDCQPWICESKPTFFSN